MGKPARLPKNAPKALREFVACRTTTVKLDASNLGWIPKPPGLPDSLGTKVTVKDGSTPTTATLEVGFGEFISMDLPVSIGKNGELKVAGSDLPLGIGPRIDAWVADFNDTLKENGKGLDGFEAKDGTLSISKKAIVVANEPVTPVTPPPKITKPAPAPIPPPKKESSLPGCFTWLIVAAVAFIAVAGIAIVALTGGDTSEETTDRVATEPIDEQPAPEPTTPPSTEAVVADPEPVDDTAEPESEPVVDDPTQPVCGLFEDGFGSADVGAWEDLERWAQGDNGCDPSSGYVECDATSLPCWSGRMPPLGITSNVPGWSHTEQVPDAVTGDRSASVTKQSMWFQGSTGRDWFGVRVANDCGGQTVTGEAPIADDTTEGAFIEVVGPLFSFGPCGPPIFSVDGGPGAPSYHFPGSPDSAFVVDGSEPDAAPPDVSQFVQSTDMFDTTTRYLDDVNTIHNVIGNQTELDDSCLWFFPPDTVDQVVRVLDQCQSPPNHFWVFAAATTNVDVMFESFDTVASHTGAYVNPLGDLAATAGQLAEFDASTALFDSAIFPCGPGHVAYTACPADPAPVDAGGYAVVSGAFLGELPLTPDGTTRSHTADFAGVGGQTYTAAQTDDGWTVESSGGSLRARALLRDNALSFLIPRDELPDGGLSYQWSTTVDGATQTQPVVPVMGLITTPTVARTADDIAEPAQPVEPAAPTEPTESLDSFYEQLSASVSAGDVGFAFDRLHPAVLEAYPTECPAALESFADPDLVIQLVSDNGPEPWTWELSDGRAFDVPDAVSVTIRLSGRGQEGTESDAHVAIVDGGYRWFTFCGEP